MATKAEVSKTIDWSSRKYRAAWYLTLVFILLLTCPPAAALTLSLVLGKTISFVLLPVEFFVGFIGTIWCAYFGANVVEKHKSFNAVKSVDPFFLEDTATSPAAPPGSGGQPRDTDNP